MLNSTMLKKSVYTVLVLVACAFTATAQDDTFPPQDSTPTQIPASAKVKKVKKVKKTTTAQSLVQYVNCI
jgi:hypothetical protein